MRKISVLLILCMLSVVVMTSCSKDNVTEPDIIPEDAVWYETQKIVLGSEYDAGDNSNKSASYLGMIDDKYYYSIYDMDYINDSCTSKIIAYNGDGSESESYDIAAMHPDNPYYQYARIIDGEIILKFYDGNVRLDRRSRKLIKIDNDSGFDMYMGCDYYDGMRIDRYYKNGVRINTTVYKFYEGDELVKEFDMEEYLPDVNLTIPGHIIRLAEHRYLIIETGDYNQDFYELYIDAGTVTDVKAEYAWLDKLRAVRYRQCGDDLYALDADGIYRIDLEAQTYEKYVTTLNFDIPYISYETEIYDVSDDRICLGPVEAWDSTIAKTIYILNKAENNPNASKKIIRISASSLSGLEDLIRSYNSSLNDSYAVIDTRYMSKNFYGTYVDVLSNDTTFFASAEEAVYNKLTVDVKAGDGPDIILGGTETFTLDNDSCLIDLNSFIDGRNGIDRTQYFDNILRLCERGGALYHIPLTFNVEMIATVSGLVRDDQQGFTFDEYGAFVSDAMNGTDIVLNGSSGKMNFTKNVLRSFMYDLIDEDGNIDFNNSEFTALVTYAHDNSIRKGTDGSMMNRTANYLIINNIWDFLEYCGYAGWNYDDVKMLGIPATVEKTPFVNSYESLAITRSAADPEGCWEFVKYLVSKESQDALALSDEHVPGMRGGSNLINREAFGEAAQRMVALFNHSCDMNIAANQGLSESDMRIQGIPCIKADSSVVGRYVSMIESLRTLSSDDASISMIVEEELQPYYEDAKTLDECIAIMNNRAQLVLDERR